MKGKILIAIAAVLTLGAVSARAASQNDSGCGLGSMLIKDNIAWKQVLGATVNEMASQTIAISAGTSGCQSGGLGKTAMAQQNFVLANYRDLSREMAAGGGEYVASLSSLMGCTDAAAFGKLTQAKYQTLYPAADTKPEAMLGTLRTEVKADGLTCNAI